MFNRLFIGILVTLFFLTALPVEPKGNASGQENDFGKIIGQVLDKDIQMPLPGANVIIEGTTMGAAGDDQGRFVIPRVPSGIYSLRFRMMGYKEIIKANVVVNPRRTTVVRAELEMTVLQGEDVVVTAGYFEEAQDAVVSNRRMDFEEIRMDPGSAEDVQRAVQALPAVVSGADQDNEIIVRGGMPGENLFLMDNIEIPNPNHFGIQGTTGGPINMVNTYFIRKVDFYAGAFPAKYGDRASSVMDISLRDGNRERHAGHFYLGMSGVGGMAEGPLTDGKGSWILSARKSYLELVIASTGLTAVPKYYNLQGKLSWDISSNQKLIINGIYGDDRITIEDEGESGYSRGADNVRSNSHQYAVGASLRSLWGRSGYSYLTFSRIGNYWHHYVYHLPDDAWHISTSFENEHTLKYDLVVKPSRRTEITAGTSIKWVGFDHNVWTEADTIFCYDTSADPDTVLRPFMSYPEYRLDKDIHSTKAAGYLQFKWTLWNRLTLNAGFRYDYFHYIRRGEIGPRVGLSLNLFKFTYLNFAYGDHYQSPAYIEGTVHENNRKLKHKMTRQYIIGLEHLFREDMRATLEAYYKTYRNVPIPKSWTTPDPFDSFQGWHVSEGRGYAKGVEFFLQKKMSQNLHFTISYSHSIAKANDPRYDVDYNWDYDFRDVFTFICGYRLDFHHQNWYLKLKDKTLYKIWAWIIPLADQLDLSLRWRYLGGRPYTEPVYYPKLHYWVTEENLLLNTSRYRPYHRLDLRIDRRFMFRGWNMITFFDLMNVYSRYNLWGYSYKDDGSKEEILQWKVFPVGGVAIEF